MNGGSRKSLQIIVKHELQTMLSMNKNRYFKFNILLSEFLLADLRPVQRRGLALFNFVFGIRSIWILIQVHVHVEVFLHDVGAREVHLGIQEQDDEIIQPFQVGSLSPLKTQSTTVFSTENSNESEAPLQST